jgi:hypothetical protein
MTARTRFEQNLAAWVVQFEATTKSSDPLWSRTFFLKNRARNLSAQDPRMKRLHQKLDSGLNILIGQAAQRQKFLTELRAIGNSN